MDDKKTLLSHFLHAGMHCSDAKKDQIESALGLFNISAKRELLQQQRELATNFVERMEYTAAVEKAKILSGRVENAYSIAEQISEGVRREGTTYKAATWDRYAPALGLIKKGSLFPSMALEITTDELFGAGGYSPQRLIDRITSANGQELLDIYLGSMQHIVNYQDKIVRAVLFENEFLSD